MTNNYEDLNVAELESTTYDSDITETSARASRTGYSGAPGGEAENSNDYHSFTDEKLAGLYSSRGDGEAFNRIAVRYGDKVFGLALKMIRDPHDAEDVRQEVLISLLEKMGSFKGNSRFSTWLYKITLNACFMKLNKARRKARYEVSIDYCDVTAYSANLRSEKTPEESVDFREIMELIQGALSRLPERNRTVFELRDIEGLSNAEAGEILGMSESAVKSQILRTRLFIREWLCTRFRDNENRKIRISEENRHVKCRNGTAGRRYMCKA